VPSEELEKSLRAQVDQYIEARLNGLHEEITRLQSQLNEAFTRLLEHSTDETQSDTSIAVAIGEHLRAAHDKGIEEAAAESSRTKASSDLAILKAAIDDIDNQRSQADILGTLVNRASSYAPRVLFFLIKNDQAVGWRGRGLEGSIGDDSVRNITIPLTAETPIKGVSESRATASVEPGAYAEDHLLLERLGSEPPQRMVAVPLVVRDKTVAVLYADSAQLDTHAINLEALESLVRVAGMAVELLAVTRSAPVERPARFEPTPFAKSKSSAPQIATSHFTGESTEPHAAVAHDEAATPAPTETHAQHFGETPMAVEAPAHSAYEETASESHSSLDSHAVDDATIAAPTPTAEAAPPASFAAPLGTKRRYGSAIDTDLPVDVSDDEKRLHNDARRFARLLVSEIKLYNEQKVREGRVTSDIYGRLREDIDRSRQMYDKRVAPPVAARYDYFHQELVNTLAEGDAAKLGSDYPGAIVSA
jgi:hypothetical protein